MKNLAPSTQRLIQRYQEWYRSLEQRKEKEKTIHVDEVASRVAAFYEKIRGVVEWKQEHLFRKTAISRILKRRLLLRKNRKVAGPLVRELIRGGHFPNDVIPESKIEEVQNLIDKYIFILNKAENRNQENHSKFEIQNWLLEIAACEIEDILETKKEKALIDYMTEIMKKRIEVRVHARSKVDTQSRKNLNDMSEPEKETQIYIAVQRALFKLDESLISYHLLQKRYSNWKNLSQEKLEKITENIYSIWESIRKDLNCPLSSKFYKVCEKYDTPFLLLGDVLEKEPERAQQKLANPKQVEREIREVYNRRTKNLKSKLARAAVYATLSIFLTNVLSLLAVEIPFTKYITGHFNWFAIGVDVLGPTLLMAGLVITIRPPGEANLQLVMMEVMKIVYQREKEETYPIRSFPKRGFIMRTIVFLFYLFSFLVSFGIIIWGLYQVDFPPLSYVIFIVFLSLIAFAGIKIRERAKELEITTERETVLQSIIDLFSLPVIRVGKWLSERWEKYNIVSVLFSALIDMPFQTFVEFVEQWRYFLKEKKEEIH